MCLYMYPLWRPGNKFKLFGTDLDTPYIMQTVPIFWHGSSRFAPEYGDLYWIYNIMMVVSAQKQLLCSLPSRIIKNLTCRCVLKLSAHIELYRCLIYKKLLLNVLNNNNYCLTEYEYKGTQYIVHNTRIVNDKNPLYVYLQQLF